MQKVLNAFQIREADQHTILHEPISSIDLMERAASRAFFKIKEILNRRDETEVSVLCGPGNNGGDGLVIARLLKNDGFQVRVYLVDIGSILSPDCATNLKRFDGEVNNLDESNYKEIQGKAFIDALFGSGLSRPIESWLGKMVKKINTDSELTVAIDVPSGLFSEQNFVHKDQVVIQAHHTISFQQAKLCLLFPENETYVGQFDLVDIGLSQAFIEELDSNYFLVEEKDIISRIKARKAYSHKGTYGHALLLAGSYGKFGAATLAARAALRSGLGLLTMGLPKTGNRILQIAVPEAMTIDVGDQFMTSIPTLNKYSAIGIGPGISEEDEVKQALGTLLENQSSRLVLDADAINLLAANKDLYQHLPSDCILTPHPGEFRRLVGQWSNDYERLQKQVEFSKEHSVYVVLKGKNTSVSCPDGKVFFNPTGNSGMATGGSGDVLTGIITGLLAQAYDALDAALIGVYVHGLAGDLAAEKKGQISMIASDIIDHLPQAFLNLSNR